jgi:uncharacterized damage-inducible protein DinB
MVEELRELFQYNSWANHRYLAAVAGLSEDEFSRDLGSSFPSVGATLRHILEAEWIWLQRWLGTSPPDAPDWDTRTPAALATQWDAFEESQRQFLAALGDDDVTRIVDYRNIAGKPYSNPLWQLMRHVANHSSYHRGQVATMLRQLGKSVPTTDLIAYYREPTERRVPGA